MSAGLIEWLTIPAYLAASVLPGLGVALWAGRRLEWGLAAIVSAAFAVTLAMAAAVAGLGHLAGAGPVVGAAALGGVGLSGWVFSWRAGGLGRPVRWDLSGSAVALAAMLAAAFERPWFAFSPDTFYHLAAVRSLIQRGELMVTDPFFGTSTTALDPTSGTLHGHLAMVSAALGVDVAYLWVGVTAVGAGMVMLAFWSLARRVSGSALAASVAAVGYGVFGLLADFRMFGQPNRLTIAFALVLVLAAVELLDREDRYDDEDRRDEEDRRERVTAGVLFVLAGLAAMPAHLGTAQLVVVLTVLVVFWAIVSDAIQRCWRSTPVAFGSAAVLAAISAPLVLGRVGRVAGSNVVGVLDEIERESVLLIGDGLALVRPGYVIGGGLAAFILMTVLAAVAVYRGARSRDGAAGLTGVLGLVALVLLTNPLVTPHLMRYSQYMVERVGGLLAFAPFMVVAWGLGRSDDPDRRRGRLCVLLAAALLLAHGAWSLPRTAATFRPPPEEFERRGQTYTVAESREADVRGSWGRSAYLALKDLAEDDYPVIAATPPTGYAIAAFAPVRITASPVSHTPLVIAQESGLERREDMEALFDPDAGAVERRDILERYDAEYVALWTANDEDAFALPTMGEQDELFEPVIESRRLVVFRVLD